jgi:hypothetical protein
MVIGKKGVEAIEDETAGGNWPTAACVFPDMRSKHLKDHPAARTVPEGYCQRSAPQTSR